MATGSPLAMRIVGFHGASSAGTSSIVLNSAAPNARCRIGALWADSTAAVFNTPPAGWTKLFDAAIGSMRCAIVFTGTWDPSNINDVTFGMTTSVAWSANTCDWEGMHGVNPIVGTPITGTGGATTTLTLPAMTVGPGLCGLWFWAAKFTAGASSRVLTAPADLVGAGSITPTGAVGIRARGGAWLAGASPSSALQLPAGSTGTKSATLDASTSMTSWSGIGLALQAADLGGQFALAA